VRREIPWPNYRILITNMSYFYLDVITLTSKVWSKGEAPTTKRIRFRLRLESLLRDRQGVNRRNKGTSG